MKFAYRFEFSDRQNEDSQVHDPDNIKINIVLKT